MRYTVFVEMTPGSARIVLTETDDGEAAAQLVSTIVSAAQGVEFSVGVTLGAGEPTPSTPMARSGGESASEPAAKEGADRSAAHGRRDNRGRPVL